MTGKLMVFGIQERLKVYVGILILYLLYLVVASVSGPLLDVDLFGVYLDVSTFPVLGMAAAALVIVELFTFVRDFYSSRAYLVFSLPVNGREVVGSRFGLFMLDFVLLILLDLPIRLPFIRAVIAGFSKEIAINIPWLTSVDMRNLALLAGTAGVLMFTIVPLLTYFLIALAKCVFDLGIGWLTAFVVGGYGVVLGLGYLVDLNLPRLIDLPAGAEVIKTNPFILLLLLLANMLFFWAGTWVIDRKLNI